MNIPTHPDLKMSESMFAFFANGTHDIQFDAFPVAPNKKRLLQGVRVGNGNLDGWWTLAVENSELHRLATLPPPLQPLHPLTDWPISPRFRNAMDALSAPPPRQAEPIPQVVTLPAAENPTPENGAVAAAPEESTPVPRTKRIYTRKIPAADGQPASPARVKRPGQYKTRRRKIELEEALAEAREGGKGPRLRIADLRGLDDDEAYAAEMESVAEHEPWNPLKPTDEVIMVLTNDSDAPGSYPLRHIKFPNERSTRKRFHDGQYRMVLKMCPAAATQWFPNGSAWYVVKGTNFGLPITLMQILTDLSKLTNKDGSVRNDNVLFYAVPPVEVDESDEDDDSEG